MNTHEGLTHNPNAAVQIPIKLIGSSLHIGQHIIPLQNRSKTFALVNALATDTNTEIDRDSLVYHVYETPDDISERLRISQYCSLNKLISRSRNFLKQSLQGMDGSRRIEWFVYCARNKRWSLYQIKEYESLN